MAQAQLRSLVRHLHRLSGDPEGGPSDRQLLEHFVRRRDEAAFATLVQRHGDLVLEGLAKGVPGAHLTQETRAALSRQGGARE